MSEEMFYNLLLLFAEARSKIKRAPCQDMDLYLRYGLVFCMLVQEKADR